MADKINFTDLQNQRGLDPRAVKALELRKRKKQEQQDRIKREKAEREMNTLRSRMAIIDRQIKSLEVRERGSKASLRKGQTALAQSLKEVVEVTKELGEHQAKLKSLKQEVSKETNVISRFRSSLSGGSHGESKHLDSLNSELSAIEKQLSQLENKKRRVLSEISREESKVRQESSQESKDTKSLKQHEGKVREILQEMQKEQSIYNRLRAKLSADQKEASQRREEFERTQKRLEGSSKGVPSLLRDKRKLEDRIKELNRIIKSGK